MAASRMHMYLALATLSYVREGTHKQRQMNQVIAVEERRIDLRTMETAKVALVQRLEEEMGVPKQDVKDFAFGAFSYLGHMTEREFQGKTQTASTGPKQPFDA
jgi:hypothetical protein